jgi:class 3 adenylate cyclase
VPELDEFLAEPREQLPLARVIQVRSESLITAGLVDDGEIEAARALDLAERGGDRLTVATAGLAHGFAALARASPWDAIGRLEPALDAARSTGDWYIQNTIETRLAFAQCTAGHLKEAEVVAEAAAAVATANHEFSNRALAHATAGTVAYLRGDFRYSSRLLETAASEGRRAAYAPMVLFVLAAQVLGLFATGARDQAWHAIESANDLPRSLRRALRAVVGRDPGGGPPAERFKGITDLNVGIAAATVTARSELVPGDLGAIVELFEQAIDGGLAFPATVPISVHRALGRTLTLQGRLQAARDQLAEAERLCRSEDAFCELTLALLQAAQLDDRLGRREQSLRQALAAQRLAQRLGMPLAMAAARCVNAEGRAATTVHPPQRLILVSDIVGSTAVSHELGDRAYFDLVMEHHGIVRQLLAAYDGTEFSEGGDSLLAWFESTSEAIDCARAIQAQAAARRRIGSNLAIRIGIAGGDPFFSHGRPYGAVVNRAARLATKARPHQIVMDEATANSADTAGRLVQTQVMSLRGMGPVTVGILDR